MKRLLLIFCVLLTIPSYASTMCAVNNSVAVILDPSIDGTSSGYDIQTNRWWVDFPYGRIYGTTAYLSKSTGSGTSRLTDTNSNNEEKLVVGGEFNGTNCWCQMLHPARSLWIYAANAAFYGYRGEQNRDRCLGICADFIKTTGSQRVREAMYGSISD